MEPIRVLFVCVENACRSQMAEAFANALGAGRMHASSTGSKPRGQVDATAIEVMRERGIEMGGQMSKGVEALPQQMWDAVVTMGCQDACPTVPARRRIDWQIPDPARQPRAVYCQVRDAIEASVRVLIDELTRPRRRDST